MYAPADTFAPRPRPAPPAPPRIPPRSTLMKILVRRWDYRHPRVWIVVRLTFSILNLAVGMLLLASGDVLGQSAWFGLLPLTGSALLFLTVLHLQRAIQS